jgi:hypothetical protein
LSVAGVPVWWEAGRVPERLYAAVKATGVALDALCDAPGSVRVLSALDQAGAAVSVLEPDLTARALGVVLVRIEQCYRAGLARSSQMEASVRTLAMALRIDERWR